MMSRKDFQKPELAPNIELSADNAHNDWLNGTSAPVAYHAVASLEFLLRPAKKFNA